MAEQSPHASDLSTSAWGPWEQAAQRFDRAWAAGERPTLEDYLPQGGPERFAVLVELVHADLEHRLRAGEAARVEEYLARYPELAGAADAVLGLIAAEWEARARREPALGSEEYVGRFPQYAPRLEARLATVTGSGARPAPPADADLPRLPGYEVLSELGRGGMGVVYKARQVALDRPVALKMILAGERAASDEQARFQIEAKVAARLSHPNIVQVHEVGVHDRRPFFSLEFLEGGTLAGRLAGAPQPPREAAALAQTLARAVQYAHECGVIHRDLKPANILLRRKSSEEKSETRNPKPEGAASDFGFRIADFEPKVSDFGLAKRLDADSGQTRSGAVRGTPSYMAPEQAAGKVREVGPAADIYALGAILYELLTGRPPFRGASVLDTLEQVRSQEPVPPARLQPKVPRDLDTICLKCLQKDPAKRYATAGELAEDLRRFQAGEPIKARPVGLVERLCRWARRNPALALLWGVLAAGVLVSSVLALGFYNASQEAEDNAELARASAKAEKDRAAEAKENANKERDARRAAEAAVLNLYETSGLMADEQGRPDTALLWFANAARLTRNDPNRAALNRLRAHNWGQRLWVPVRTLAPTGPASSPHLTELFFASRNRLLLLAWPETCLVWDVARERPIGPPSPSQRIVAAALNRTGTLLARATSDGEVDLVELGSSAPPRRLPAAGSEPFVDFSADGRRLAVAGGRQVYVWDCRRHKALEGRLEHPAAVMACGFAPDGSRLVTVCKDNRARVFPVTEQALGPGPLFAPLPHDTGPTFTEANKSSNYMVPLRQLRPLFVAEGQSLVTVAGGQLQLWDAQSGKLQHAARLAKSTLGCLLTDPAGSVVLLQHAHAARPRLWDVARRRFTPSDLVHPHNTEGAAFSPDGRELLTAGYDGRARIWSVSDQRLMHTLVQPGAECLAVAFSPDGQHLAAADKYGRIRVWARPESTLVYQLKVPSWYGRAPTAVSCDGRYFCPCGPGSTQILDARVLDARTGLPAGRVLHGQGYIHSGAFSPQAGELLLVTVRFEPARHFLEGFDWRTGRQLFPPLSTPSQPLGVAYSPDGRLAVAVCEHGEILWVDPARGTILRTARHEEKEWWLREATGQMCRPLLFAADGRSFVTCGWYSARVWDTATGRLRYPPLAHNKGRCSDVDLSPDGRWLVTPFDDGTVRIWDYATGQPKASLKHPDGVFQARFSPDGRYIATACRDHVVRLWDWQAGRLACPAMGHANEALCVCFSPDGRWIYSGGGDQTVRVWDRQTGRPVVPAQTLSCRPVFLDVRPDQRRLIVTGYNPSGVDVLHEPDLCRRASDTDDLCAWGEILSGQWIDEGGSIATLTPDEWLERWRAWRRGHAEKGAFRPASGTAAARHREAAEEALAAEDWFATLQHLDRLVRAEPKVATWWGLQGYVRYWQRQWAAMAEDYARAAEADPGDATYWAMLGLACNRLKQWDRAQAAYTRALKLAPQDAWTWYGRGVTRSWLGDWPGCRDDDTQAIRLRPDLQAAWKGRGKAQLALGALGKAIADYTQAIKLDPRDPDAWFDRAESHTRAGHWPEAEADYTRVIELGRNTAGLWNRRQHVRFRQRRWEEALADANRAIELEPGEPLLHQNRAECFAELGQWKKAAADLAEVTRQQPGNGVARRMQAVVCLAAGDTAGYRRTCAELLKDVGKADPAAVLQTAIACTLAPDAAPDLAPALRAAGKLVVAQPKDRDARMLLGALLYRAGRSREAVGRLEQAITLPGRTFTPYYFLALAHHRLGDRPEARKWLQKASAMMDRLRADRPDSKGPSAWERVPWFVRVPAELLRREAEAAVQAAPEKADP